MVFVGVILTSISSCKIVFSVPSTIIYNLKFFFFRTPPSFWRLSLDIPAALPPVFLTRRQSRTTTAHTTQTVASSSTSLSVCLPSLTCFLLFKAVALTLQTGRFITWLLLGGCLPQSQLLMWRSSSQSFSTCQSFLITQRVCIWFELTLHALSCYVVQQIILWNTTVYWCVNSFLWFTFSRAWKSTFEYHMHLSI